MHRPRLSRYIGWCSGARRQGKKDVETRFTGGYRVGLSIFFPVLCFVPSFMIRAFIPPVCSSYSLSPSYGLSIDFFRLFSRLWRRYKSYSFSARRAFVSWRVLGRTNNLIW
ncbi:hypothetical protein B0H12DRAFT_1129162 [Mycena haematopus]|nr:hypothetical protein B0H12DRAFT_1129162 [Mycena haematopus]